MRCRNAFRAFASVLVLVAAVATAACDVNIGNGDFRVGVVSGKAQDEWTRSYDLKPGTTIQIVNINGRIDAQPAEGGRLEVRAERIAKARTDEAAREILDRLDILETSGAEGVKLQTKPRERLSLGQQQEVRYHLKVPAGVDLDLQTVNGGVEVNGVKAGLIAATTNGGVKAYGLAGRVEASTTNGGIELEFVSVEAEIKAETVNGGVRLMIPEDSKADILARCVNGSIGVDNLKLDSGVERTRTRRRLEARLNGGGPKIEVETTNGGIRIAGKF